MESLNQLYLINSIQYGHPTTTINSVLPRGFNEIQRRNPPARTVYSSSHKSFKFSSSRKQFFPDVGVRTQHAHVHIDLFP